MLRKSHALQIKSSLDLRPSILSCTLTPAMKHEQPSSLGKAIARLMLVGILIVSAILHLYWPIVG